MIHPSSLDLEAFACGELHEGRVGAHVDECGACSAFVARLRDMISGGAKERAAEAEALVARALERVEAIPSTPATEPKRKLWLVATSVITPLAAAAAILLLARAPSAPAPTAGLPVAATTSTATPAEPTGAAAEPDTTFKGGLQLAVVRERAGEQRRFSSTVRVRPGDRLRVEVALDREQAILGAVLADDGTYLELMPQAVRGPGTHFSERSAKIDASPTVGTIVIGPPEAVALARRSKRFDGLATLRVEWEGTP